MKRPFARMLTLLAVAMPAIATAQAPPAYVIRTIAGGALPAVPFPATSISIGHPTGIAVDASGNIYFTGASVVFKLDSSGMVTRIAGMGGGGYSGDGGPANQAQLNFPRAFPFDTLDWSDIVGS